MWLQIKFAQESTYQSLGVKPQNIHTTFDTIKYAQLIETSFFSTALQGITFHCQL